MQGDHRKTDLKANCLCVWGGGMDLGEIEGLNLIKIPYKQLYPVVMYIGPTYI